MVELDRQITQNATAGHAPHSMPSLPPCQVVEMCQHIPTASGVAARKSDTCDRKQSVRKLALSLACVHSAFIMVWVHAASSGVPQINLPLSDGDAFILGGELPARSAGQ
jgi:hypothetical protein